MIEVKISEMSDRTESVIDRAHPDIDFGHVSSRS
jgi:hypothetical protein